MLGRAYKVAKSADDPWREGGILIWSSGHGINIMGTDRHTLIFFHDENGYFGDNFHHENLFLGSSKFKENKQFMRNLLKHENTKFSIFLDSADHERGIKLDKVENIFMKIPTKSSVPTAYDINNIKLLDQIDLRQGKSSTKPQPVVVHFTDNNMLCGIRQHAFLLSMPYSIGEMTLKDVFKPPEEGDKNIFELALTNKKYKQIFNDFKKFFPDLGFEGNKNVYTRK